MIEIPFGLKKVATLCVLRNDNRFLLLKRKNEPNKGLFTPVGGKLNPFENPIDAALRETHEETGIKVTKMKYGGLLTESSPTKYNWVGYVYEAFIDYISPPSCPEGRLEWISFDDILNVPTPSTDWYIYKYLKEGKPFAFDARFNRALHLISMVEEIENVKLV